MQSKTILIRNNCATFAHSKLNHWNDGTRFIRGSTYEFNRECLQQFYDEIDEFCPNIGLRYEGESDYHTVYKRPTQALEGYMYFHINNEMNRGYSWFHYSVINNQDIVLYDGTQANIQIDVPIGERVYIYPRTLVVTMTGDGCAVSGTPINVHHMSFGFLKVCAFISMSTSRYINFYKYID